METKAQMVQELMESAFAAGGRGKVNDSGGQSSQLTQVKDGRLQEAQAPAGRKAK